MVTRRSLTLITILNGLLCATVVPGYGAIDAPHVSAQEVRAGLSTPVTVTSAIAEKDLIPGSVQLQRIGADGRITVVGRLHDDGLEGDLRAGDNTWSIRTVLNESAADVVGFRVSVALKGSLLRKVSSVTVVNVAGARPVFDTAIATRAASFTALHPAALPGNTTLLDYEGFNDGAPLTTQYTGITFANAVILQSGVSLNEFEFPPHSGTNVVSDQGGPMTISFSAPASSVSAFFTYSTGLTIKGYDSTNTLVATATSHFTNNQALSGAAGTSPNDSIQISYASGLSKIVITGSPSGGSFTMDDSVITAVGVTPPPLTPPVPSGPPPLQITSQFSLGTIPIGSSVNATLAATGGVPPYKWAGTNLPAGITVSAAGQITGTPTQAGLLSLTISVTDAEPLTILQPVYISVLGITTATLSNATAFVPYSQTISAIGGTQPYSFSATGLPPGISISGTGALGGTPTKQGTYTLTVRLTDGGGIATSASLTLVVNPPLPLAITSASLPSGTTNVHYSQTLTATGGAPPYTWAVSSGSLPPGLNLTPTGTLAGTPTQTGAFTFNAQATDNTGGTAQAQISVSITPPALTITVPSAVPSGMAGVEYPVQIATAAGGTAPYTFSVGSGSLPQGMTLGSDGTLGGTPSNAGNFTFSVKVTDSASAAATATATVQLAVRARSTDLALSAGSLTFSAVSGASSLPATQTIQVRSTGTGTAINWSAALSPAAPWLTISSGGSTPGFLSVALTSQALSLAASTTPYQTTLAFTCSGAVTCSSNSQTVTVSLTVSSPPAQLSVLTNLLAFSSSSAAPAASQNLNLQNTGSGTVGIASIQSSASWLQIGAYPASIAGGPIVPVSITANPAGLGNGFYRSTITISSSSGVSSIPVSLLVADNTSMVLSPAGQQAIMTAGGSPGPFNNSIAVTVSGSSPVAWTAAVQPGASWLTTSVSGGTSTSSAPGSLTYSIDPGISAGLAAGTYYGTIRISSSQVLNSPQDFQIVLTVAPATSSQVPNPAPQGLLFIGATGSTLPPQTVQISSGGAASVTWQASATTADGKAWLSVTPANGTATPGAPSQSVVSVNTTGLAAGTWYGNVSYAGAGAAVRSINVTLLVTATPQTGSARTTLSDAKAGTCAATQAVAARIEPVLGFSTAVGLPTPVVLRVVTNCGDPVTNAQVAVNISTGDPSFSLQLANPTSGLYTGTWTPRHSGTQVSLTATAAASGLASSTADFRGSVTLGANPLIAPLATLHVYYPQTGSALAPGTIVQIYGANFATQTASATTLPLPVTLSGTSVSIGGIPAPLYYVSSGQINAQVPSELQPNHQYQVIVNANGVLSAPDLISVSALSPGLDANPNGSLIAQHLDGTLVTSASPAQPGEYIQLYGTGLGATDRTVADGAGAPSNPVANALNAATVTINGEPASVLFTGLTPGLAGLYQVDVQVPADAPNGALPLVLSQNSVTANSVTLAVHN
jgi:large repetitive protein